MRSAIAASELGRRPLTLLLAATLLLTALAMPGNPALAAPDQTFADDFQSYSFAGSTGSLPWAGPWLETGESDGVGAGSIQVQNEPHCETDPCLTLGRTAGPDATVEREADLSRFVSATLTFDYKIHAHLPLPGDGSAALRVSGDGGGSWNTLDTWSFAADSSPLIGSYDISDYIANDTRILFAVAGSTDDSHMNIDNLEIAVTGALCYLVGDSGGVHQLTSLNLSETDPLGAEVTIGNTGADLRAIALDPFSGDLYAATAGQLHTVDTATGAVSTIGPFGSSGPIVFSQIKTLSFDPTTGALYASHYRPGELDLIIQVDPATGAAVADAFGAGIDYVTFSSDRPAQESLLGLAIDATGLMWGMGWDDTSQEELHYIDKTTGVANADFNSQLVSGLTYDPQGTMWGLDPVGEIFEMRLSADSRDIDNLTNYTGIACQIPPPPINQAPVFDQDLLDRTDAEGTFVKLTSPATDPDIGDTLTYTATGLPEGISIDSSSGNVSGALSPNSSGTHSITITVTDDGAPNLQDTDVFTWTVVPGEVTYLVANSGGANGGDDLLTVVDRTDLNPATNEVDIGTGTGTWSIEAAALQPGTNVLFAVDGDQLGTINVTAGTFAPKPSIAGAGNGPVGLVAFDDVEGLSFNPFTRELYGTHRRGANEEDILFRFDPVTGAHVPGAFGGDDYVAIEARGGYWHAADIAFDPTDGQLYVNHWTTNGFWSIATVDPETGITTTMGAAPDDITSLAFDEMGRLYTSTDSLAGETLYQLNKADGSTISSLVIDNGSEYEAMAIAFPVDPNQSPAFNQDLLDRTDPEGAVISRSSAATDPDGGNLTYAATGLPPGLAIDENSGLITGTISFTATGSYVVEIEVTDDGIPNLTATDTFTWTVVEANQPPVFDQDLPDRIDAEGTVIALSAAATDPDIGDTLTYDATGLPPGLNMDTGSGLITGTIDYTAAATSPHAVTITVIDDGLPNESAPPDTFTWTVSNTNRPPVIVNPGAQTTPELAPFSIVITASDPDGAIPALTDSSTLPAWAVLTDNLDGTATIAGTPGAGDSGTTNVTVTASDGGVPNLSDDAVFDLTVTNTNLPPNIANPGNQLGAEAAPFSLVVTASDPDGTTVSFSDGSTLPAWATLTDNGDNTATIAGTPTYTDAAITTVTITASDGSLSDDAIFDITIANTNRAPIVDPIADQSVAENDPFSLVVTASDPDGTIPTLTATGLPGWATLLDNGDGTAGITGTPGFGDTAVTTVTITANDGALPGSQTFDLTVTNVNLPPTVDPVTDRTVAEGTALPAITITSTDPDGTFPSLAATGLPGWARFVDNGDGTATITGTPGYDDAVVTTVTVNAEDGGIPNLADSTTFQLTVTNTNRAPTVDPVADQSVAEGNPLAPVTVTASDPDSTIPSLAATGLPAWATFTDNGDGTATITGTPGYTDAGLSTVTVTASDGTLTNDAIFDLTVTNTNQPPTAAGVPDRSDAEGTAISVAAGGSDPDGDTVTHSATGLPPGLTIDANTGLVTGTITYSASTGSPYTAVITLVDSGAPSMVAADTFTWTVTDTNRAPVFDSNLADRSDAEGAIVSVSSSATDPDLDSIAYDATGLPPGLSIDPTTGVISGTVSATAATTSPYSVHITATDDGAPPLDTVDSFTWTITDTNRPPQLQPIADQLGAEESLITFTAVATDPDADGIVYGISGQPTGAALDPVTGVFTWTPTEAHGTGSFAITVTATDTGTPALGDSETVTITVEEVNRPPVIDPIADQTDAVGTAVTLAVAAHDPDIPANALTFGATGLPPGLAIDPTSGIVSGVVASAAVGSHAVEVTAKDDGTPRGVGLFEFKWTISDTNLPPSIASVSERTVAEGSQISFTASAQDPDGDSITFSLSGEPEGASVDPASGRFTWTPSEEQGPGTYRISIVATDLGSPRLTDSTRVTISVTEVNKNPEIESIEDQASETGDSVFLRVQAGDPDLPANDLTYAADGLPGGLSIDRATGVITGVIDDGADSEYAVGVTVSDDGSPQAHAATEFAWAVAARQEEAVEPPQIDAVAEQYSEEEEPVTLQIVASGSGPLQYEASGLPPGLAIDAATGLISGTTGADTAGSHHVMITVVDTAEATSSTTSFFWIVTDVAAAEQKDDLVVALESFSDPGPDEPAAQEQEARQIRRTLVVMGGVASATTEALSMPFALLLILLVGFATMGRVGLYPLLWRGDRHRGTITFFDQEMRFGLIEPEGDGEAVFVHAHAFPRRQRATLHAGTRVRYRLLASDNRANAWGATTEGTDG